MLLLLGGRLGRGPISHRAVVSTAGTPTLALGPLGPDACLADEARLASQSTFLAPAGPPE